MYTDDKRVVMTLDAGGTNFVFSAVQGDKEVVEPIRFPSHADNLVNCLSTIERGFTEVKNKLGDMAPVAISFAFPGPADYEHGIIGDLPNFPSFRGGVALGPFLEERFGLPVFINNDGNLFAYGEAICGALPKVNEELAKAGSTKQYKDLLGVTLGTGFGGGVVINQRLLIGDNSCGGDVWCFRNKLYPDMIAEESVSIRAVKRVYKEMSGEAHDLTPKDIFDIAEGTKEGIQAAAVGSFEQLGQVAGDVIASALNIVDGIVVVGGGLSGAAKYIIPSLVKEMNSTIGTFEGSRFPRLQLKAYDLADEQQLKAFLADDSKIISVPFSEAKVRYVETRKVGVITSVLGTSKAVAMGAYAFALSKLDNIQ